MTGQEGMTEHKTVLCFLIIQYVISNLAVGTGQTYFWQATEQINMSITKHLLFSSHSRFINMLNIFINQIIGE